jgi:predicted phage terminase large subunit-like protein
MTFKDTKGSDFVVGQVWERRGAEVFLLDQVRARLDFPATCRAVVALSAKWPQAHAKLIEDKANGPAVIAQLRQRVPGLIAITPKDSKQARASAVAPFVEAGNTFLPPAELAPWVGDFVEECAAFPSGSHDDQVDAMSQALARLLLGEGRFDEAADWLKQYRTA